MNQQQKEPLKMTASITPDMKLLVAYLPDNPEIELNLKGFSGKIKAIWLNPKTGDILSIKDTSGPASSQKFARPADWENAVLKLNFYFAF